MDHYVRTGDKANFLPPFGPAIVTAPPGVMQGSASSVTAVSNNICLEGDEKNVSVTGMYFTPSFPIPGAVTVTIKQLGGDQTSKKTKVMNKPPILKGTMFQAMAQVTTPASIVTPGGKVDDPAPSYMGQGQFITTNATVTDGG